MIRALLTAALLTLAALPARAIEIQQATSPGGIQAWLVEDHSIPFVALSILFRGGASMDAPDKRGAVNLMTATLEEGAGDLDSTGFAQAVEDLGARLTFDADDDAVRPGELVNSCRHRTILGSRGWRRRVPCATAHRRIAGGGAGR